MMLRQLDSRFGFFAALIAASFILTGCPGPTNGGDVCPEGEVWDDTLEECVVPPRVCELWEEDCCIRTQNHGNARGTRDCFLLSSASHTAVCDQPTGTCILLCNTHADCADFYQDRCGDGDCVCDDGVCPLPACSSHADCAGEGLCIGGECLPGVTDPDGCVISPDPVYTKQGETVALYAYATKGGQYVVAADDFAWSSSDDAVVGVGTSTGIATGGTTESAATITATVAGASCTVDVVNFAAIGADDARVLVLDEITRLPIVGAKVVIDTGVHNDLDTLGDGVARFDDLGAAGNIDVHVFADATAEVPNGYSYISAVGTTARDLVFYLPRNPTWLGGGIKGTLVKEDFTHIGPGDVHVALAGLSIPGNFIDIDLNLLVGEMIDTHVKFQTLLDDEVPLPSGLVLGLSDEFFKPWYAPMGVPGVRTGWMLGGNLSIQEVIQVAEPFISGGTDDIEIGPILGALLPMFDKFYSAVTPGLTITEGELPESGADWPPASFSDVSFDLTKALALKGIVDVPTLPQVGGAFMDGAIVLGGALVEGQGLVPLGLTAGVDTDDAENNPADGRVNDTEPSDDPAVGLGQLAIRLAPQHGGIEGSRYAVLALAIDFDGLTGDEGRNPLSGFVKTFDSLGFEEHIDFGATDFLPVAESASFAEASRTYTPSAVTGASMYRASISATNLRGWIVYHGGTAAIELVNPADFGFEDRASSNINAQAVLTHGGVGVNDLFEFNDGNLDGLMNMVLGFSTIGVLGQ